jgi:hypothetical protein
VARNMASDEFRRSASGCALLSVLVGALSTGVTSYIVSARILGAFFALQSGTVDSTVYDTLTEEVGTADGYEKHFGRIQMWNSVALTGSGSRDSPPGQRC